MRTKSRFSLNRDSRTQTGLIFVDTGDHFYDRTQHQSDSNRNHNLHVSYIFFAVSKACFLWKAAGFNVFKISQAAPSPDILSQNPVRAEVNNAEKPQAERLKEANVVKPEPLFAL